MSEDSKTNINGNFYSDEAKERLNETINKNDLKRDSEFLKQKNGDANVSANNEKLQSQDDSNELSPSQNVEKKDLPLNKNNNLTKTDNNSKSTTRSNDSLKTAKNFSNNKSLNNSKLKLARDIISSQKENGQNDLKSRIANVGAKALAAKNPFLGAIASKAIEKRDEEKLKRKTEEDYGGDSVSVRIPKRVIVSAIVIFGPVLMIVILLVLIITSSQVYLTAFSLKHADDAGNDSKEINIDNTSDDKLDTEVEDVSYKIDIYIDNYDEIYNYEFVAKKEDNIGNLNIEELEDFYPDIINYSDEDYDQSDVYRFFYKLYCIYNYYEANYKVKLDIPLIMSVLELQSNDMANVFKYNIEDYKQEDIDLGIDNPNFDINKDWSNYKPTKTNSSHDIEVLAQGMVREGSSSSSNDSDDSNNNDDTEVSKTGKEAIDKLNEIALQEAEKVNYGGQKYWSWYGLSYRDEWCAMFVSWLFNQVNGLGKYIKGSAVAGAIPRESVAAGYGSWHEDECTDPTTVPQAGDVIVFDPWIGGTYIPYPKHSNDKYYSSHVGYVYKVDDTYVYTVEGNSGDSVKKKQYNRKTHCATVGTQGINGYFRPKY